MMIKNLRVKMATGGTCGLCCAFAVAHPASASHANWSTGFRLQTQGSLVNPALFVAFNPQPEPPELGRGGFQTLRLDSAVTQLSSVTLSLRIEDDAGNPLNLILIPEPVGLPLLPLRALIGLPLLRTRITV